MLYLNHSIVYDYKRKAGLAMVWSWVGNTYMFIEQEDFPEPGQPHCNNCGCFLSWHMEEFEFSYGYPGQEENEKRWGRKCRKCGNINFDD